MDSTANRDCVTCIHRDRQIFVVGAERFNVEIFGHFIGCHTPASWKAVPQLQAIPPLSLTENHRWRLIFLDCNGMSGCSLLKHLQTEGLHLLGHDVLALFNLQRNQTCHAELLAIGIRGFFYQDDEARIILKGICALNSGEIWVSRECMMDYIANRGTPAHPQNASSNLLTRRERSILALIAGGSSNEEIASRLFISKHTVKTHLYNIFKKIDVPNRLQAALWAAKHLD